MLPDTLLLCGANEESFLVETAVIMNCSGLVRRKVQGKGVKPGGVVDLPEVDDKAIQKLSKWIEMHSGDYIDDFEARTNWSKLEGTMGKAAAATRAVFTTAWDFEFLAALSLDEMKLLLQHAEIMEIEALVKMIYGFLKEHPEIYEEIFGKDPAPLSIPNPPIGEDDDDFMDWEEPVFNS